MEPSDAGDRPEWKRLKAEAVHPILPRTGVARPLPFDVGRGLTPEQHQVLNPHVQRELLRRLHATPERDVSAQQLVLGEDEAAPKWSVSCAVFHLRKLISLAAVTQSGPVGQRTYRSTVATDPQINAVLHVMEASDMAPLEASDLHGDGTGA